MRLFRLFFAVALGVVMATTAFAQTKEKAENNPAPTSVLAPAMAPDKASPNQLVQEVVDQVLTLISNDPKVQNGDVDHLLKELDGILNTRFDFRRMTVLAMGRNWRTATTEQQQTLVNEFKTLLVRTYSKALIQFRDDKIVVKPLRAAAGAKDLVVESEFIRKGEQPVPVNYSLILGKDEIWRCYDVVVGGVSLVTNFRDEFNSQVKNGGIDGLIQSIVAKNKTVSKK